MTREQLQQALARDLEVMNRTFEKMQSGYIQVRTGGQDTTRQALDDLQNQLDTLEGALAFVQA